MKTRTILSKILACGIATVILCAASPAGAALTTAQKAEIDAAKPANLATVAGSMVNKAAASAKEQLAKDIAADVAKSKPNLAPQVVATMAALIPASASAIAVAAVNANNSVAAAVVQALAKQLPAQAAQIAAAVTAAAPGQKAAIESAATSAATTDSSSQATVVNNINPLNVSTSTR